MTELSPAESCKSFNSDITTPSTSPDLGTLSFHNKNAGNNQQHLTKVCRVCGDKALGYNFNVVSCESCKAFFRRNALTGKEFRCPFANNCDVSVVSRRFCQKCRLQKCFEVGMKKDWIMSEEARSEKRQRIEQNREKRKVHESSGHSSSRKRVASGDSSVSCDSTLTASPASVRHGGVTSPQFPSQTSHQFSLDHQNIFQAQALANDCISIPKSVLINILSSSGNSNGNNVVFPQQSLDMTARSKGYNGGTGQTYKSFDTKKNRCVCQCTCGAKPPGSRIGGANIKTDKCVMTDPPEIYFEPTVYVQQPVALQPPIAFGTLPTDLYPGVNNTTCSITNRLMTSSSIQQQQQMQQFINLEDSVYKVLHNAISSEFADGDVQQVDEDMTSSLSHVVTPSDDPDYSASAGLNDFEHHKLQELISANEVMNEPMEKLLGDQKKDNPSLTDVINMTDIAIRRIIKMSKRIECFKNLCQEDQIALLKGGCTELMILRGVMSYDPEKDSWHGPRSHYIKLEVLKGVKGNVYEEHKRYLHSFNNAWRTNEPLMILLCAITLFTPDRPNVTHKEIIKTEQEMYYNMLKHYLESAYGRQEAKRAFEELVENIEKLHRLNENAVRIFLDVNPKDVEPLLIEIFDLK